MMIFDPWSRTTISYFNSYIFSAILHHGCTNIIFAKAVIKPMPPNIVPILPVIELIL